MTQHSDPIKRIKGHSIKSQISGAMNIFGVLLKNLSDLLKTLTQSLPAILSHLDSKERLVIVLLFLVIFSIPIIFIVIPLFVASLAIINSISAIPWTGILIIIEKSFFYLFVFAIVITIIALIIISVLALIRKSELKHKPETEREAHNQKTASEFIDFHNSLSNENREFLSEKELKPIVTEFISSENGVINKETLIRVLARRLEFEEETARKKLSKLLTDAGNIFIEEDIDKHILRIKNGIRKEEIYAIWHINSEKLYNQEGSRVASLIEISAPPRGGANWWEMPWADVLILESKICNKETFMKTIENLLATTDDKIYLYRVHLAFMLIASFFSEIKILGVVFQKLRDYHVKITKRTK